MRAPKKSAVPNHRKRATIKKAIKKASGKKTNSGSSKKKP